MPDGIDVLELQQLGEKFRRHDELAFELNYEASGRVITYAGVVHQVSYIVLT